MPANIQQVLDRFVSDHNFKGKGPLSVALVVTNHVREEGLPLDQQTLVTEGGGQVRGLGKAGVQSVLKRHRIDRVLAAEGGRTSRNSVKNMREYVALLNDLHEQGMANVDAIEAYWVDCVRAFFASQPFRIRLDASHGLRRVVRDVLEQAVERQKESPGVNSAGAVLQHLVGAKLDCALGLGKVEHRSFSTADAPGDHAGDFPIGDVAIHVTTTPGESVIERCRNNLDGGRKPVLVTIRNGVAVAEGLAENAELAERIDVFEIEQFVALNLYEWSEFEETERRGAVARLVRRYNEIVEEVETDPSLKIEI
ncbi:MAG: DUF4928 family protein [Nitrospinae bacterium]|nr:DUF4928 family protein [Nitrospinota bacterium]